MLGYAEYEALPPADKWMAHATLPAPTFFDRWRRKLERLVWMPVWDSRFGEVGGGGRVEWYATATTRVEEEEMLASDIEFELDEGNGSGSGDCGDESGDGGEGKEGVNKEKDEGWENEGKISDEEVEELLVDAFGKEDAEQKRLEWEVQKQQDDDGEVTAASSLNPQQESTNRDLLDPNLSSLPRKTRVRSIAVYFSY